MTDTHSISATALSPPMRRLRNIGALVLVCQLAVMLWWRWRIWSHFSLTDDFSQYWQAWWNLNHGHLNPFDSIAPHSFWHDHGVFLMWPLAVISHFGLGGYAPLVAESALVVAAEAIAFWWILELLNERGLKLALPNWAVGAICLVLLVANPWTYWGISFDVHFDVSAPLPFLILAMRALYKRQNRQLVLWTVLCLAGGDLAASFVAALGLAGLAASAAPSQRRVRPSAALVVVGVAWFVVLSKLGGNVGSVSIVQQIVGASNSGPANAPLLTNLATLALHPWHLLGAPIHHFRNVWALESPAGFVGLLSPWGFVISAAVAMENTASGSYFSAVGFQYIPVYAPLAITTVFAVRSLSRFKWGRRVAAGLLVLSLANSLAWAVIWLPHVSPQWLRVDTTAARVLSQADRMIPQSAEVIASQGVVGRFADRPAAFAYPFNGDAALVPVTRPVVYFILVPYQGIEIEPAIATQGIIGEVAGRLHATLVLHGGDVWVFRWNAGATLGKTLDLRDPLDNTAVPAWTLHSSTGMPDVAGPSQDWAMSTRSRSGGYLAYGAYFRRPLGHYVLRVRLAATGPVTLEAWNGNNNSLLARRRVPATEQITTFSVPVDSDRSVPPPVYRGSTLFKKDPVAPPPGEPIEGRVYLPPGESGKVYDVRLVSATK